MRSRQYSHHLPSGRVEADRSRPYKSSTCGGCMHWAGASRMTAPGYFRRKQSGGNNMRKIILTTVAVCAAMLFAAKAPAQQPAPPPAYGAPINLAQAQAAAAAADAEAKKNGWN